MPSPPLENINIIFTLQDLIPAPPLGKASPAWHMGECPPPRSQAVPGTDSLTTCVGVHCLFSLFFFFFRACMCSSPPPVARIKDFLLFGSFPPPYTPRCPITRACQRGSISRQGGRTGQNQSEVPRLRIASVWLRK